MVDTVLIEPDVVERVLASAMRRGGEFAEVFAEDRHATSAVLDDGRVEELSTGRDRGAGVRVVAGETTGYAHTADLSEGGLLAAAEAAAAVAREAGVSRSIALSALHKASRSEIAVAPESVSKDHKIGLLRRADHSARAAGSAVSQVSASYGDSRRRVLVANSDGVLAADDQVRTRFSVSCVAVGDAGMQTGFETAAFTVGFELFDSVDVDEVAGVAARRALSKLTARPAPSGEVPVVLASGSGGILFHEACGHGLEADHILKDASVYVGQVGRQVASPLVTLIDDATVGTEWGSFGVDDEGRPAQRTVLIENGVLTDYLWDFMRARKEGRTSSGNGRRQSYRHLP
ncbi:MAG TPA: TldD/PmbA family protein, partial [Acidimicrobiales bacterium]|nr:TldD/PmbA family protein [Acidimicrobiales bacterium]